MEGNWFSCFHPPSPRLLWTGVIKRGTGDAGLETCDTADKNARATWAAFHGKKFLGWRGLDNQRRPVSANVKSRLWLFELFHFGTRSFRFVPKVVMAFARNGLLSFDPSSSSGGEGDFRDGGCGRTKSFRFVPVLCLVDLGGCRLPTCVTADCQSALRGISQMVSGGYLPVKPSGPL